VHTADEIIFTFIQGAGVKECAARTQQGSEFPTGTQSAHCPRPARTNKVINFVG
jgi:hypothetical protein